jgi:DNA-binding LytR/AlgR family response regulator
VDSLLKAIGGTSIPKKEYKERYIIRLNDRIVPVAAEEIAYIYSEEKTNWLVTFNDKKYIIDSSLDVMGDELDPEKFFRISRGCIVSMNAITSIVKQAGSRLRIISKPEAPFEMTVSRSRVDDFLVWLER